MAMVALHRRARRDARRSSTRSTVNHKITSDRNEAQDRARQRARGAGARAAQPRQPDAGPAAGGRQGDGFRHGLPDRRPDGPNTGLNASNVKRVRYCLDRTATPPSKVLWTPVSRRWTTQAAPGVPVDRRHAPATRWGVASTTVASERDHRSTASRRPAFTFNSATLTDISSIHVDLFVDLDARGRRPRPASPRGLPAQPEPPPAAGVHGDDRRPRARAQRLGVADPEGEPLTYEWFDAGPRRRWGTGIVFDCLAAATGTRNITLKVYDPAGARGRLRPEPGGAS